VTEIEELKTVDPNPRKAIEKTEEFFERNHDLSPEILSARQHSDTDIQDIKLKVVQTINERRN